MLERRVSRVFVTTMCTGAKSFDLVDPYGAMAGQFPWSWIGDPFSPEFTTGRRVEGVY